MADPTVTPLFGVPTGSQPQPDTWYNPPAPAPVAPQKYVEEDGKHKGVAGIARDIFGTLGDFLLTRLHMPTMYAPAQQKRKLASAESTIQSDPIGAIQKVTSLDPVFGAKLNDQFIDNQRLAAAQAQTAEERASRLQLLQSAKDEKTRQVARRMLGTTATWDETKKDQHWPMLREQVLNYGLANGLDMSNELPEAYSQDVVDTYTAGDSTVNQQVQRRQAGEKEQALESYRQDKLEQTGDIADQRNTTTRRGQDFSHSDRVRGQDLTHGDRQVSQTVRERIADKRIAAQAAKPVKLKPTGEMIAYLRAHPEKRDSFDGKFGVGMAKRILGN